MTEPAVLAEGTVVAERLRVLRVLGSGGMGEVYEVEHLYTKHRRALKMLHRSRAANPEVVARFLREASAAGRIGSPHVVETFDAGQLETGEPYLVMELLEGEPLDVILARDTRLPAERAVELVAQAALGAHAAHQAAILHRDLKPANLFVLSGEQPFVKLLDFGISKFGSLELDEGALTAEGALIGTPHYMAPEQVAGGRDVDARTDVYALGVVLYECLCGERPFSARTLPELSVLIYEGRYRALREIRPDVPVELERAVARAMARNRTDRHATAEELATELRAVGARLSLGSAETLATPSSPGIAAPLPKPAAAPLRLASIDAFGPLDPHGPSFALSTSALSLVLQPLAGGWGTPERSLVERVEMASGGSEARLFLRRGVWFHPHPSRPGGAPREATDRDLAYSLELAAANPILRLPITGTEAFLKHESDHISGIETTADAQVVLHFDRPFEHVWAALNRFPLLPTDLAGRENLGDPKQLSGTGPYRMAGPRKTDRFRLVPWERWDQALPFPAGASAPTEILFEHTSDVLGAVGRVATGDLDLLWVRESELADLVSDVGAKILQLRPELRCDGVSVNRFSWHDRWALWLVMPVAHADGPLASPLVRRAVSLAIDRPALAAAGVIHGRPTGRILAPKEDGYDPSLVPHRRDVDEAKRLLAQAGFPTGSRLFELRINTSLAFPGLVQALARQLADVGIELVVVDIADRGIRGVMQRGSIDLALLANSLDLYENEPLWAFLAIGSGAGGDAFTTPELTRLTAELQSARDKPHRMKLYRDIERAILDGGTHIPLATPDANRNVFALVTGPRIAGIANAVSRRVTPPWLFNGGISLCSVSVVNGR